MNRTAAFLRARDFLLRHREDYDRRSPIPAGPCAAGFNWALDWSTCSPRGSRTPRCGSPVTAETSSP